MDVREKEANTRMARLSRLFVPEKIRNWFNTHPDRQIYFVIGLLLSNIVADFVLSILIIFLMDVWHQPLIAAVLVTNIRDGVTGLSKIFMAFFIDAYLGNFWMLILSTPVYCAGFVLLKYSYPQFSSIEIKECLNDDYCPPKSLTWPFYIALVLLIVGQSGQEISLEGFSAIKEKTTQGQGQKEETTQSQDEKERATQFQNEETNRKKKTLYSVIKKKISVRLIISIVGSVIGSLALPLISLGWSTDFVISATILGANLIPLLLATLFYTPRKACGSPLSNVIHVLVAATLKKNIESNDDDLMACHGRNNEIHHHIQKSIVGGRKTRDLVRLTSDLRFLHKAAAIESIDQDLSLQVKGWRLCTVQQVQETKLLIRMFPMSLTFFMYGIVKAVGDTYFIEQGSNMDTQLGSIKNFPIQIFVLMSSVASKIVSKAYDKILAKRFQAANKRISDAVKIGLGIALSILCCTIASWVETKRLTVIRENSLLDYSNYTVPMTVFWLTPQFLLMGAMNGLAQDGIEGFFSHQGPASMKRYAGAVAEFLTGLGTLLSVAVLFLTRKVTKRNDHPGWFTDDIDTSRLNHFYYFLTVLSLLNFCFFIFMATRYTYKVPNPDEEEEQSTDIQRKQFASLLRRLWH